MSYSAAIDGLTAPPGTHRSRSRSPRATARPDRRARRRGRGSRATTRRRSRSAEGLRPRQVRGRGRRQPRGLPVPGDLRPQAEVDRRGAGRPAARRLQAQHQAGRPHLRREEEPDRLRRPEHRLDDRPRGPGPRGARAGRRGDLQPARRRQPLGIDATLRYELDNYNKPLTESELADRLAVQHAPQRRACRRRRSATRASTAIKAAANPANVNYIYYVVKPGTCGEHVFTASEAEFEQAARRVPGRRSRRRAARRPSADRAAARD